MFFSIVTLATLIATVSCAPALSGVLLKRENFCNCTVTQKDAIEVAFGLANLFALASLAFIQTNGTADPYNSTFGNINDEETNNVAKNYAEVVSTDYNAFDITCGGCNNIIEDMGPVSFCEPFFELEFSFAEVISNASMQGLAVLEAIVGKVVDNPVGGGYEDSYPSSRDPFTYSDFTSLVLFGV